MEESPADKSGPESEPIQIEPGPVEVQAARILDALGQAIPEVTAQPHGDYIEVAVPTSHLEQAARLLKEHLGYTYLSMVTAVDWPERIEAVYLIFSLDHPHGIYLKTSLPREELPDCPSLTVVWPGAEFQEREVYDLMGINFVGHPDPRRILTDDDFPGHPLRKDFQIAADYVLMRHLLHGAEGQLAPPEPSGDPSTGGTSG